MSAQEIKSLADEYANSWLEAHYGVEDQRDAAQAKLHAAIDAQAAEIERLRAELVITKQLLDAANAAMKPQRDFKDHPGRG